MQTLRETEHSPIVTSSIKLKREKEQHHLMLKKCIYIKTGITYNVPKHITLNWKFQNGISKKMEGMIFFLENVIKVAQ